MRTSRALFASIVLALVSACGDDGVTTDPDAGSGTDAGSETGTDAGPPPGTYASVAAVFDTGCTFASCHGGAGPGAAGLNFAPVRDGTATYLDLLVDQPSCQYDPMDLVEPGDPDSSWLYIKMAGPNEGSRITFEPDPSFTPTPGTCGTTASHPFGELMPHGSTTPDPRAAIVRAWIANGAPGPE